MARLIGSAVLLATMAGWAFAGVESAPEIDGSTAVAAIALLGGALLVLRSRRSKR